MKNKTLGQLIKYQRLQAGLTQEQLGLKCHRPLLANQIAQYENDHRKPNRDNFINLIKALGCTLKDLTPATAPRTPLSMGDDN